MNDLIQALERALKIIGPDWQDAEGMSLAEWHKKASVALSSYRSSVEGVELPEAEIACAVDEFDLIQDWSKSHLAPGVHYLYTATTVRRLIAEAVEREREALLQRLDEAEAARDRYASESAQHFIRAREWAECAGAMEAEVQALRRGEFICGKCGLRKNSDAGPVPF